jgi:hypothetical protein
MKSKSFWQSPVDRVTGAWWFRFAATIALVLILGSFVSGPHAQLQQSGGGGSNSSVGTTGSTAPTSAALSGGVYNTSLPTLTNGQMGAEQMDSSARQIIVGAGTAGTSTGGVFSVQGVGGGTALPVSGTVTVNALPAGTNLIGYSRPPNACSTTAYESGMVDLPTSSTSVTSTPTCVTTIILNNTSASAQTVSVQDQSTQCNSAACNVLSSFSIPANSEMDLAFYGAKFTGGIKWNAATANTVVGDIIGNQ